MFGGSVDLAILSDSLALHRAKRFWWSGYAMAGICGYCPITAIASWECVLWPARTIGRRFIVA
ncbi:MAG: hypothetical protein GDA36_10740 [Rhodobacteraceae bacterium]|nr:hypothetical protein [Paracoccaceae bacterium]